MLKEIKYHTPTHDYLELVMENGRTLITKYPCETYHNEWIHSFINRGGVIAEYTPIIKTDSDLKVEVDTQCKHLLSSTDWTQLPDVPVTTQIAFKEYRQTIRDVNHQEGYPSNIVWPEQPVIVTRTQTKTEAILPVVIPNTKSKKKKNKRNK